MAVEQKTLAIKRELRATLAPDEARTPWLIVLHGMALITAGLRKWLNLSGTCEHCGRQF